MKLWASLKEAFCTKGGSFQRINGIENMNMFRQDLQTVLFPLSPLEVFCLFPVPSFPTILCTTKAKLLTVWGSFLPCPQGVTSWREWPRGGLGGGRHCLVPFFELFVSSMSRFSIFFNPFLSRIPFLRFYPLSGSQLFHLSANGLLKWGIVPGLGYQKWDFVSVLGSLLNCCTALR